MGNFTYAQYVPFKILIQVCYSITKTQYLHIHTELYIDARTKYKQNRIYTRLSHYIPRR